MDKEEEFDKAFEEMIKALKELPPDIVDQMNKNLDKIKDDKKKNNKNKI